MPTIIMAKTHLTIDDHEVSAEAGASILDAARAAEIYIPALCTHPELACAETLTGASFVYRGAERIESDDTAAEWDGCGICAVGVAGQPDLCRACTTEIAEGMVVNTGSEKVLAHRREKLSFFLADHPHACLTCAQQEGCSRTQCSANVPEDERCCELLGSCELQRLAQFVGIPPNLPRYRPRGLPHVTDEPLFDWNTELCIGCLRCVRACRDLRGVGTLSFVMKDGRPIVGTTDAPSRAESHCRFCGACVEVCPTGALMDKTRAVGDRRDRLLVPCRSSCPAGVDIPRFVRHIARQEYDKAIAIVRQKLPFSFAPSYICFHPCEDQCRRGLVNRPIAVCQLKRFVADHDTGHWRTRQKKLSATGKRVVVVGSGPAGLTAAYYLAKQGHAVTVFESLLEAGGMLRVGIPEFRYPCELLQKDIEEVKAVGVEIRYNSPVDGTGLEGLAAEYDAVLMATGAHAPKRIDVPGKDLEGVHWGVDFLRGRALGEYSPDSFRGQRVVVIGGGNVAVDAARVARRLGTDDVCLVSLETPEELPAYEWEVEDASAEGIGFLAGWGVKDIKGQSGKVNGVVLKRCTRVFDGSGRFSPVYDESQTREEAADAVILAIGQDPSSAPFEACGLGPDGTITADETTLATKAPKVYAAGDVVSGPASVIGAIAMGRKSASEIDKALGGDGDIDEKLLNDDPQNHYLGKVEHFAELDRAIAPKAEIADCVDSFTLIEQTLSQEDAVQEAGRCLACDLRVALESVVPAPRAETVLELLPAVVEGLPELEGVYQLFDEEKNVLAIKGVMNLKEALSEVLEENDRARSFVYEQEPMYTKRESELIQQYLQEHGELPGGGDDELDDLF
ncbi:MAG: FAD-dependent oxidoreductase [Pirellulaceae bacterium]|nr:FAD-dependent oxidoreductase [Pirellulaceae bacterium]